MSDIDTSGALSRPATTLWDWAIMCLVGTIAFFLEGQFLVSAGEKMSEIHTLPPAQGAALYSQSTTLLLGQLALVAASVSLLGAIAGLWRGSLGKGLAVLASFFAVLGAGLTCWVAGKF